MPHLNSNQLLGILFLTTCIIIGIGTVFYHYVESLSWLDATYFSTITLTTIGYGDISPKTDLGKLFTIPYALTGIGILGAVINTLAQRRTEKFKQRHIQRNQAKANKKTD